MQRTSYAKETAYAKALRMQTVCHVGEQKVSESGARQRGELS